MTKWGKCSIIQNRNINKDALFLLNENRDITKEENMSSRKGFFRKVVSCIMTTALCVGAFVIMPITANAAHGKEEVLGNWRGMGGTWTFCEDGTAVHEIQGSRNPKPYHMEDGTLTIEKQSGNEENETYNLWYGDGTNKDDNATLTVFRINGDGTINAWNVTKTDGKWIESGNGTLRRINTPSPVTESSGSHNHNYEWEVETEPTETTDGESVYKCIYCGHIDARQPISANVAIRRNLEDSIKKASAGSTVTFDNKAWLCYPQYILDVLKEKGDVSLKTDFTYEGVKYSFTIPAGSDYSNLEPADFYGYMYLLGAFGGTAVE